MTHTWRTGGIVSCCYECERREPGCHGGCPDYQAFVAKRQSIYAERQAASVGRARWRADLAKKAAKK